MPVLVNTDRMEIWKELMSKWSRDGEEIGVTKSELRDAINAIDDFLDTNASAINNALPQPAKAVLSPQQKAIILSYVALKRYEVI